MTPASARGLLASLPEGATAGPWANVGYPLRGIDGPEIMGPGDQLLCTLDNHPNDLANAALIAAAPALRDALGEALDRESTAYDRGAAMRPTFDSVTAAQSIARLSAMYDAAAAERGRLRDILVDLVNAYICNRDMPSMAVVCMTHGRDIPDYWLRAIEAAEAARGKA